MEDKRGPIADFAEEFALSLPKSCLDWPWGSPVAKVAGRIFIFLGTERHPHRIGVKLTHQTISELPWPEQLRPWTHGLGNHGWLAIELNSQMTYKQIATLIVESYELVDPYSYGSPEALCESNASLYPSVDSMMSSADQIDYLAHRYASTSVDLLTLAKDFQRVGTRAHIAVMREPYLTMIISGVKTIETRLTRNRVDPFATVATGDLILFKKSGGPVVAVATVGTTEFLGPTDWSIILSSLRMMQDEVRLQADWLASKEGARYASLVHLSSPRLIEPFRIDKADRRPWVTLVPSG